LAEDRPYRDALGMEEILSIIQGLAPHKLDAECVAALVQVIAKDGSPAIYSPGTCAKTATNMFGRKILTPA
jgi:HD-GYP domain-containing protein (c-di-GMP phosphodiesterase class II)